MQVNVIEQSYHNNLLLMSLSVWPCQVVIATLWVTVDTSIPCLKLTFHLAPPPAFIGTFPKLIYCWWVSLFFFPLICHCDGRLLLTPSMWRLMAGLAKLEAPGFHQPLNLPIATQLFIAVYCFVTGSQVLNMDVVSLHCHTSGPSSHVVCSGLW